MKFVKFFFRIFFFVVFLLGGQASSMGVSQDVPSDPNVFFLLGSQTSSMSSYRPSKQKPKRGKKRGHPSSERGEQGNKKFDEKFEHDHKHTNNNRTQIKSKHDSTHKDKRQKRVRTHSNNTSKKRSRNTSPYIQINAQTPKRHKTRGTQEKNIETNDNIEPKQTLRTHYHYLAHKLRYDKYELLAGMNKARVLRNRRPVLQYLTVKWKLSYQDLTQLLLMATQERDNAQREKNKEKEETNKNIISILRPYIARMTKPITFTATDGSTISFDRKEILYFLCSKMIRNSLDYYHYKYHAEKSTASLDDNISNLAKITRAINDSPDQIFELYEAVETLSELDIIKTMLSTKTVLDAFKDALSFIYKQQLNEKPFDTIVSKLKQRKTFCELPQEALFPLLFLTAYYLKTPAFSCALVQKINRQPIDEKLWQESFKNPAKEKLLSTTIIKTLLIMKIIETSYSNQKFNLIFWYLMLPKARGGKKENPRKDILTFLDTKANEFIHSFRPEDQLKKDFAKLPENYFKMLVRKKYDQLHKASLDGLEN